MNSRTSLIAIAVALLLSGAVYLLSRRGEPAHSQPVAPVWLQTLDAGVVIGLEIDWGQGVVATLEPSGLTDVWMLSTPRERWPIAASRVRATVRLVRDLVGSKVAPESVERAAGAHVTIRLRDGGSGVFFVHDRVLGGRGWVTIPGEPPVTIAAESQFVRLFRPEGISAWRAASPIVAAPGDATRLAITAGELSVELARVSGHWRLTAPASTHADRTFTEAALTLAYSLKVSRFVEAGDITSFQPGASVATEMRALDGRTLLQTAEIGQAADAGASGAFVRAQATWHDAEGKVTPAWGPSFMVVDRASIEKLTADPRAFAGKSPTHVPAADVLGIEVGGATFLRELNGWSRDGLLLDEATVKKVGALLDMLCEKPAKSCTFGLPEGWSPLAPITLRGSRGTLDAMELGSVRGVPFIRTGAVCREVQDAATAQWAHALR